MAPRKRIRFSAKRLSLGCLGTGLLLLLGIPAACRVIGPGEDGWLSESAQAWADSHPEQFDTRHGIHAAFAGPEEAPVTVFLVHGSPGNWGAGLPYLASKTLTETHRVVSFDRPGYGKSNPGTTVESFAEQASALVPFAEDRPGTKLWLGHSFGAPIVAQLAIDRPDLVDGLVLSASAMDPDLEQPRWYHHLGDTIAGRYFLNSEWIVTNEECLAFADELALLAPRLSEIECPVLILHARDDALADFRHAEWTEDQIGKPDLVAVRAFDQGNHFILWNRVEAHLEALHDLETLLPPP